MPLLGFDSDVLLKDEGDFGSVIFDSERAKQWACNSSVPSDYANIFPDSHRHDCDRREASRIANEAEKAGLTVEREY